jgi:hypothetical protein
LIVVLAALPGSLALHRMVSECTRRAVAIEVPAVGLNEHRGERLRSRDGPFAEVPERFVARSPGPDLEVREHQLFAHRLAHVLDLARHADERLVEAETRFHADDQQVERVRQRTLELELPLPDPLDIVLGCWPNVAPIAAPRITAAGDTPNVNPPNTATAPMTVIVTRRVPK